VEFNKAREEMLDSKVNKDKVQQVKVLPQLLKEMGVHLVVVKEEHKGVVKEQVVLVVVKEDHPGEEKVVHLMEGKEVHLEVKEVVKEDHKSQ
jgi:hypothetical protein